MEPVTDPLEDLVSRALADERRGLRLTDDATTAVVAGAQRRAARTRQAHRALTVAAAVLALVSVAVAVPAADDDRLGPATGSPSAAAPTTDPSPSPSTGGSASPSVTTEVSASRVPPVTPQAVPGRAVGVVTDEAGTALEGILVMRGDLTKQLGVTGPDGGYDVPCDVEVLLSARGVRDSADRAIPTTSVGNHAWRRVEPGCGSVTTTALPPGGVVEGTAYLGSERSKDYGTHVTLVRMRTEDGQVSPYPYEGAPSFRAEVAPDGTYRLDGLDTGTYWIEESVDGFPDQGTFLDVDEGRTVDGSFAVYVHEPMCREDAPCPE